MPQANRYALASPGQFDVENSAPQHPVAVQGPTDPANLYAILTWDRNDSDATGYVIYRDDVEIATVTDVGGADDWDKRYYRDTGVTALATHEYQVAAIVAGAEGPQSARAAVTIRRSTVGKTIDVTSQSGATLRDKIGNALTAALATGPTWLEPAVLFFPAGTHVLATKDTAGGTFSNAHSNIIVRGASETTTIIRASFAGDAGESGTDQNLFKWLGPSTVLPGINPASAVARSSHTVTLDDASAFSVGDVIGLNDMAGAMVQSADHLENYNPWDANEITAKDGNTLTVRYPWAKPFPTTTQVLRMDLIGCGIEQCTVEGDSSTSATYYTLLMADTVSHFHLAEVRGRWCNRNVFWSRGYKRRIVNCTLTQTDPKVLGGESLRYDVSLGRGANDVIVDNVFGDLDRVASSMITNSVVHRQVVRHNQFLRSENYGWNVHGAGDFWNVCENNYFYMPEATKGGVFLGNSSFYYAGPTIVRANLFDECDTAGIACQQNSWELRILDNWFRDCPDDLVNWYGSDFSSMAAATYGSARSTVKRNQCDYTSGAKANRGMVFGLNGGSDPYPGVRDLIVSSNELDVDASAVNLGGTSAESFAFQVYDNTGASDYTHPTLISGDYWANNMDGGAPTTGDGSEGSPYFTDLFGGTAGTSAGWPTYLRSTVTGVGSDFTISSSGNYGRLSCTTGTAGARKINCALRAETMHDSLVICDLRDLSDAVSRRCGICARHTGTAANDDHYRVLYEYAAGSNRLRLEKVISGTATVLQQTTSLDADLIGDLRFKLEVSGTTVRAKAWLISGAEPGAWMLEVTDSAITAAGKVGVIMDSPDSTTTIGDFDNYKLVNWTRNAQEDFGQATVVEWSAESFPWELADVED